MWLEREAHQIIEAGVFRFSLAPFRGVLNRVTLFAKDRRLCRKGSGRRSDDDAVHSAVFDQRFASNNSSELRRCEVLAYGGPSPQG
jgi:hypothetical protein